MFHFSTILFLFNHNILYFALYSNAVYSIFLVFCSLILRSFVNFSNITIIFAWVTRKYISVTDPKMGYLFKKNNNSVLYNIIIFLNMRICILKSAKSIAIESIRSILLFRSNKIKFQTPSRYCKPWVSSLHFSNQS